jgi:hypothetical protein
MDCAAGVAEMLKSGPGLTAKVAVPLRFSVPLVPVTVKLTVPEVAPSQVLTLSVEVAATPGLGVTDSGEKLQTAPAGSPEQASVTGELNPPDEFTVTVKATCCPAASACEEGETATLKSGVPPTLSTTVVLRAMPLGPVATIVKL